MFQFGSPLLQTCCIWIIVFNIGLFSLYVTDFPPQLRSFAERVRVRLSQAYRPSTHSAHRTAVTALAMFCIYYDVSFPAIGIHTLLSFIEFLINSNLSVPTVKNYVSSIKSFFKANSLPSEVFLSHHLTLALASLTKNYSPPTSIKLIFTPQQLIFLQLIVSASHLPLHVIYKMAFILGFLGLFRISNVALLQV
jgi:hypothetical protein